MSTIPISDLIQVTPSVLAAGLGADSLLGLMLTSSTRVPIGTVQSFTSPAAVSAYFGANSDEYAAASVYFAGFSTKTATPGSLSFVQYNQGTVAAYLRGGAVSGLSLTELQALSGSLSITIDGYVWTNAAINLSAATSFSNAASIIETGLTNTPPTGGSTTAGSIAPGTCSFTGAIAGELMYVTGTVTGTIVPGTLITGTGVTAGQQVTGQISGTAGGAGVYSVLIAQNGASAITGVTIAGTYGIFTAATTITGTFTVGQVLSGTGVTANTKITGLGTGTGGAGTYYVDLTQTTASTTITAVDASPIVTYDSTSGAFIVSSGFAGADSTIAFATGTLASSIMLTSATGAVTSQGAAGVTPGAMMDSITALTQAWATFEVLFDPDGESGVLTQREAFMAWNSLQGNRYCYICSDTSATPTTSAPATGSLGYAMTQAGYSGTNLNFDVSGGTLPAFVAGYAASINFNAKGGRATAAYKSQSGLTASVTTSLAASNLLANAYNFYGAYGNPLNPASPNVYYQNGSVSGPFTWLDTYLNQIWLNGNLRQDMIDLLTAVNSIPYNRQGRATVAAAMQSTLTQAVFNGVIVPGINLSSSQVSEVNTAAGVNAASIIQSQGYYLQVGVASAAVRQARTSPPITLWYADGGSIQKISIASIALL